MHRNLRPPGSVRRRGQALVELALILIFMAVLILATLTITGQSVRDVFDDASCALSGRSCAPAAGTGGSGGDTAPPVAPTPTVSTSGGGGGKSGSPPIHPTPAAVPTKAGVCPAHNPHCTP